MHWFLRVMALQIYYLYKAFVHFVTGKSQLERICLASNASISETTLQIYRSIQRSRQIPQLRSPVLSLVLWNRVFDPADAALQLAVYKKFKNVVVHSTPTRVRDAGRKKQHVVSTPALARLELSLSRISSANRVVEAVCMCVAEHFDQVDSSHHAVLETMFELLMGRPRRRPRTPNGAPTPEMDAEWPLLGFQGKHPETDLRGAGMLPLYCIRYFASRHGQLAQMILLESSYEANPEYWYPFACAAIHFASALAAYARQQVFHHNGWWLTHAAAPDGTAKALGDDALDRDQILVPFFETFVHTWVRFHAYWKEGRFTVMQFELAKRQFFEQPHWRHPLCSLSASSLASM
eukprot:ANDGO_04103.mRNA.1 ELMO domain-containing protein B